mmetsp:Transcript_12532/g.37698  ORF Transcript_12532/g.37698 Transcript_12532/m.37698 type:complete len:241 (-) Transcript_12532:667-1389(-)
MPRLGCAQGASPSVAAAATTTVVAGSPPVQQRRHLYPACLRVHVITLAITFPGCIRVHLVLVEEDAAAAAGRRVRDVWPEREDVEVHARDGHLLQQHEFGVALRPPVLRHFLGRQMQHNKAHRREQTQSDEEEASGRPDHRLATRDADVHVPRLQYRPVAPPQPLDCRAARPSDHMHVDVRIQEESPVHVVEVAAEDRQQHEAHAEADAREEACPDRRRVAVPQSPAHDEEELQDHAHRA